MSESTQLDSLIDQQYRTIRVKYDSYCCPNRDGSGNTKVRSLKKKQGSGHSMIFSFSGMQFLRKIIGEKERPILID